MVVHRAQQIRRATDVDVEVLQRNLGRLANCLFGGEVNHRADRVLIENPRQRRTVAQIGLVNSDGLSGDPADPFQGGRTTVGVVVDHHHLVAGIEQLHAGVAADEAGATGHQNRSGRLLDRHSAQSSLTSSAPSSPVRRPAD